MDEAIFQAVEEMCVLWEGLRGCGMEGLGFVSRQGYEILEECEGSHGFN